MEEQLTLPLNYRQPSWQSSATKAPEGAKTFDSVRKQLGIDWDLVRRPRRTQGAERWADIVRTDTNEVVNPKAAKTFKLVSIADFGQYVEAALHHQNVVWDTFHIFDHGAAMASTVRLDEPLQIKGDSSPIFPYMAFTNRVDGKGSLLSLLAMNRMSCSNMLNSMIAVAKKNQGIIKFTHGKKFNMTRAIEMTRRMIDSERDMANQFAEKASLLNERRINVKRFVDVWLPLSTDMTDRQVTYTENKRLKFDKALTGAYAVGRETAWGVLQAAVESYQHDFPVKGGSLGREHRAVAMMNPSLLQQSELKKAYRLILNASDLGYDLSQV